MLDCRAWRALSLPARAAFIELARIYNGRNNGTIAMSARALAERLRLSKDTAARALTELETKGFVERVKPGSFNWKQRHATEFGLTLYRCDVTQSIPSKAFMRWEENSRSNVEDTTVRSRGHAQGNCLSQSDGEDRHGQKPTFHGPT